jgi:uncharacterized membrane protein
MDGFLGTLTHDVLVVGILVLGVVVAIALGVWFLNSSVDD